MVEDVAVGLRALNAQQVVPHVDDEMVAGTGTTRVHPHDGVAVGGCQRLGRRTHIGAAH